MKNLKKLTLLHSNDLHGDFNAEGLDENLIGGVSFLSGYVSKVRKEEENSLYVIAGDMFRGSVIDSEFKGVSTIEIMNILAPDVVTLGNHEVDYGLAHLLFLEKCAKFPIINCNLYITTNGARLFNSHIIKDINGLKIMVIGILTEEVLFSTKAEGTIGTLVDIHDAAREVGKICDAYKTTDIDLTILLTHIGVEADKQLAELLDPAWGVDVIVGGHSHTYLEEPVVVNNIPIVQAVTGTDQIGRFDIMIDTDTNSIDSYEWQLVPMDAKHCPRDADIETVIRRFESVTDKKYGRLITKVSEYTTHPRRDRETQVGRIFADVTRDALGVDIAMVGSGSLRKTSMKSIVTYGELVEMFPYDDKTHRVTLTGAQLRKALEFIHRHEALMDPEIQEFYQYSHGLHFVSHLNDGRITDLTFEGKPVEDDQMFDISIATFHHMNLKDFWGISVEEAEKNRKSVVLSTSSLAVLEEHMSKMPYINVPTDERWVTVED